MEETRWWYYQDREDPDTIIRVGRGRGEFWSYRERTFVEWPEPLETVDDEWNYRMISEETAMKEIRKYSEKYDKAEMQGKWLEALKATQAEYSDDPRSDVNVNMMYALLIDGLVLELSAGFAAGIRERDEKDRKPVLSVFTSEDDKAYFALATDEQTSEILLPMELRKIFLKVVRDEKLDGVVVNPYSGHPFIIDRNVIKSISDVFCKGFEAGVAYKGEKSTAKKPSTGTHIALNCARPCSEKCVDGIFAMLKALETATDTLEIRFNNYVEEDAVICMRVWRIDNEDYHVEIDMDMNDFDWDKPLTLGADISCAETENVIGLCCKGIQTGDIAVITDHFRDIAKNA